MIEHKFMYEFVNCLLYYNLGLLRILVLQDWSLQQIEFFFVQICYVSSIFDKIEMLQIQQKQKHKQNNQYKNIAKIARIDKVKNCFGVQISYFNKLLHLKWSLLQIVLHFQRFCSQSNHFLEDALEKHCRPGEVDYYSLRFD